MKPAPFGYQRALTIPAAIGHLAAAGDEGKLIAGGQSLVPLLALRLARPSLLVDINRIPGLATMSRQADGSLRFGALTRHRALAEQRAHPLLAEAAGWIGHAAIRTRGTLGGSLAHADPSAELPVAALATGAVVHVAGPAGERQIPAGELFTGPLETSLGTGELIVAVDFPPPARWGFAEFTRRHGDFGVVTAVAAEVHGQVRLALGGVAGTPVSPAAAAAVLAGGPLTGDRIREAASLAAEEIDPPADSHATAAYRRALTRELATRALAQLAAGAIP